MPIPFPAEITMPWGSAYDGALPIVDELYYDHEEGLVSGQKYKISYSTSGNITNRFSFDKGTTNFTNIIGPGGQARFVDYMDLVTGVVLDNFSVNQPIGDKDLEKTYTPGRFLTALVSGRVDSLFGMPFTGIFNWTATRVSDSAKKTGTVTGQWYGRQLPLQGKFLEAPADNRTFKYDFVVASTDSHICWRISTNDMLLNLTDVDKWTIFDLPAGVSVYGLKFEEQDGKKAPRLTPVVDRRNVVENLPTYDTRGQRVLRANASYFLGRTEYGKVGLKAVNPADNKEHVGQMFWGLMGYTKPANISTQDIANRLVIRGANWEAQFGNSGGGGGTGIFYVADLPYVSPSISESSSTSLSSSATPSRSLSATPSRSLSATPSLSESNTPSLSESSSITPSLSESNTPSITPTPSSSPSLLPGPVIFRSVVAGATSVRLEWTVSHRSTNYDLDYTSNETIADDAPASGNNDRRGWVAEERFTDFHERTANVTGLTSDRIYRFRVRGRSADGFGVWTVVRAKPSATMPDNFSTSVTPSTSVSSTPSASPGVPPGIVTNYTIELYRRGLFVSVLVDKVAGATSYDIDYTRNFNLPDDQESIVSGNIDGLSNWVGAPRFTEDGSNQFYFINFGARSETPVTVKIRARAVNSFGKSPYTFRTIVVSGSTILNLVSPSITPTITASEHLTPTPSQSPLPQFSSPITNLTARRIRERTPSDPSKFDNFTLLSFTAPPNALHYDINITGNRTINLNDQVGSSFDFNTEWVQENGISDSSRNPTLRVIGITSFVRYRIRVVNETFRFPPAKAGPWVEVSLEASSDLAPIESYSVTPTISATSSITPTPSLSPTMLPGLVGRLRASVGDAEVSLAWNDADNAEGYNVDYTLNFTIPDNQAVNSSSPPDMGWVRAISTRNSYYSQARLINERIYRFRVQGYNISGAGPFSFIHVMPSKTNPEQVSASATVSITPSLSESPSPSTSPISDFIPSFFPADGDTNNDNTTNIIISFGRRIKKDRSGTDFVDNDLASILALKRNNSSGVNVPYTASINSSKTFITIDPTSNLTDGTYYVAISNAYYDVDGNQGVAASATFTIDTS